MVTLPTRAAPVKGWEEPLAASVIGEATTGVRLVS
jgi:hypothetical protein